MVRSRLTSDRFERLSDDSSCRELVPFEDAVLLFRTVSHNLRKVELQWREDGQSLSTSMVVVQLNRSLAVLSTVIKKSKSTVQQKELFVLVENAVADLIHAVTHQNHQCCSDTIEVGIMTQRARERVNRLREMRLRSTVSDAQYTRVYLAQDEISPPTVTDILDQSSRLFTVARLCSVTISALLHDLKEWMDLDLLEGKRTSNVRPEAPCLSLNIQDSYAMITRLCTECRRTVDLLALLALPEREVGVLKHLVQAMRHTAAAVVFSCKRVGEGRRQKAEEGIPLTQLQYQVETRLENMFSFSAESSEELKSLQRDIATQLKAKTEEIQADVLLNRSRIATNAAAYASVRSRESSSRRSVTAMVEEMQRRLTNATNHFQELLATIKSNEQDLREIDKHLNFESRCLDRLQSWLKDQRRGATVMLSSSASLSSSTVMSSITPTNATLSDSSSAPIGDGRRSMPLTASQKVEHKKKETSRSQDSIPHNSSSIAIHPPPTTVAPSCPARVCSLPSSSPSLSSSTSSSSLSRFKSASVSPRLFTSSPSAAALSSSKQDNRPSTSSPSPSPSPSASSSSHNSDSIGRAKAQGKCSSPPTASPARSPTSSPPSSSFSPWASASSHSPATPHHHHHSGGSLTRPISPPLSTTVTLGSPRANSLNVMGRSLTPFSSSSPSTSYSSSHRARNVTNTQVPAVKRRVVPAVDGRGRSPSAAMPSSLSLLFSSSTSSSLSSSPSSPSPSSSSKAATAVLSSFKAISSPTLFKSPPSSSNPAASPYCRTVRLQKGYSSSSSSPSPPLSPEESPTENSYALSCTLNAVKGRGRTKRGGAAAKGENQVENDDKDLSSGGCSSASVTRRTVSGPDRALPSSTTSDSDSSSLSVEESGRSSHCVQDLDSSLLSFVPSNDEQQPRHMTTSMLEKCLSSGDVTRRKRSLNQSDDGAYALSSLPPPIPAITGTSSSSSLSPSSSSQTVASGLSLSLKGPTTALQFEGHSDCEGQTSYRSDRANTRDAMLRLAQMERNLDGWLHKRMLKQIEIDQTRRSLLLTLQAMKQAEANMKKEIDDPCEAEGLRSLQERRLDLLTRRCDLNRKEVLLLSQLVDGISDLSQFEKVEEDLCNFQANLCSLFSTFSTSLQIFLQEIVEFQLLHTKEQRKKEGENLWEEEKRETGPNKTIIYATESDQHRRTIGNRPIRAATLNQLIIRLTDEKRMDMQFVKTFITTYESFVSSERLLEKLVERYSVPRHKFSSLSDEEYQKSVVTPIQLRVFNVIKIWLDTHFEDFQYNLLKQLMKFIDDRLVADKQTRMVQALTTIIKRKTRATSAARRNSVLPLEDGQSSPTKDTEREEKDKDKDKEKEREKEKERTWVRGGTVSSPMSSISSSSLLFGGKEETKGERLSPREHKARTNEIESMEQLETILQLPRAVKSADFIFSVADDALAYHLTIIDFHFFSQIEPHELMNKVWMKPKMRHRCPHIIKLTERFNNITNWVASEIVKQERLRLRVKVFAKFIRVAQICRETYHNYNTLLCIIAGINSSAVHRLKHTKDEVPKRLLEVFQSMNRLMKSDNSYKLYRKEVQKAVPPVLPYFGLHLTDLVFVEDGNPETIDGLINFRKKEMVYQQMEKFFRYQQTPYELKGISASLLQYLNDVSFLSETDAWKRSREIEPPGCEKVDLPGAGDGTA